MGIKSKMRKGFTLAEVLVTLAVIGLVAALTIPVLVKNVQDASTKASLKSIYATLNQANLRVLDDNGGNLLNLCPAGANNNTCFDAVTDLYAEHLSTIKQCSGWDAEDGSCWYPQNILAYSDACSWGALSLTGGRLVLANGMLLSFTYGNNNCPADRCGTITTDINGKKGPNRLGYDVFLFDILKNRILPMGAEGTQYSGWCNPSGVDGTGTGYSCTYDKMDL